MRISIVKCITACAALVTLLCGGCGVDDKTSKEVHSEAYVEGSLSETVIPEDKVIYSPAEGEEIEFESQDNYARVKLDTGKWAIINSNYEIVFTGADKINPLPMVESIATAVVDGKAVMLSLWITDDTVDLYAVYDNFVDISEMYVGMAASVRNADGLYGVVDYSRKIVAPAEYKSVKFSIGEPSESGDLTVVAKLENENGETVEVTIE